MQSQPQSALPARVAIVGSRTYPNPDAIGDVIATLPAGTLVITGDTPAIRRAVRSATRQRHLPTLSIHTDWPTYGRRAGIVRNEQIIDHADTVIAFCHGQSPETASAIRLARAAHKPVTLIFPSTTPSSLALPAAA